MSQNFGAPLDAGPKRVFAFDVVDRVFREVGFEARPIVVGEGLLERSRLGFEVFGQVHTQCFFANCPIRSMACWPSGSMGAKQCQT